MGVGRSIKKREEALECWKTEFLTCLFYELSACMRVSRLGPLTVSLPIKCQGELTPHFWLLFQISQVMALSMVTFFLFCSFSLRSHPLQKGKNKVESSYFWVVFSQLESLCVPFLSMLLIMLSDYSVRNLQCRGDKRGL